MDFQSDDFNGQYRPPARPQDVMMTASVVLSIIAIGHKGMERKPFNEEHLQWEKIHLNKYGGNNGECGEGE